MIAYLLRTYTDRQVEACVFGGFALWFVSGVAWMFCS